MSVTLTAIAGVLLIYALRASNSASLVEIDTEGVLKVNAGDTSSRFDLTSPNTKIEQTGAPGQRNWRILILRRSMSPVSIDAKMVDPQKFLEALRQWRPEI